MVARITFGKNIAGVLLYNKLKVDAGQAEALLCHNLPVTPTDGKIDAYKLTEAFRPWLEHPRAGLSKPVFHVSRIVIWRRWATAISPTSSSDTGT